MKVKVFLVLFLTFSVGWAQNETAPDPAAPAEDASAPQVAQETELPQVEVSTASAIPAPQPGPSAQENQTNDNVPVVETETTAAPITVGGGGVTPTVIGPTSPVPTTPTTTTPAPTPAETPSEFPHNVGKWSLQDVASPCIMIVGALQLRVKNGVTSKNESSDLVVDVPEKPENVTVLGTCIGDSQVLELTWWSNDNNTEDGSRLRNNTLQMTFAKQADNQYALSSVSFDYSYQGAANKSANVTGPFYLTKLDHSFTCNSHQRLEKDQDQLIVRTESLQFEAFRDGSKSNDKVEFSASDHCKADNRVSTGVILGVGVGIGLLIVVCIALGVYLFKKCKRNGYQPLDQET